MATKKRRRSMPPPPRTGRRVELSDRDLEQLETMAGLGLTWPQIAAVLRIPKRTLLDRRKDTPAVAEAYERGRATAELAVGRALYKRATTGDVPAIRWWEMTRAGRREGISVAGQPVDDEERENIGYLPIQVEIIDRLEEAEDR